jgi:hypothetical protein
MPQLRGNEPTLGLNTRNLTTFNVSLVASCSNFVDIEGVDDLCV